MTNKQITTIKSSMSDIAEIRILHAKYPDFCLNLPGNNTTDGALINLYSVNGDKSQLWNIYPDGTIRYQANPQFCLNWDLSDYTVKL